jgi:tetratricopeptide (TPR) repeat protein
MLCHFQGKNALAEQNYKRALETLGKALGPGHPLVVAIATNYSDLLRIMGRDKESELMKNRALTTSDLAKSGQFQVAQSPAKRESAPAVAAGGHAQLAAASAAITPPQVATAAASTQQAANLLNADILQTDQRSTIPGTTPEDKWDNARLHAESAVVSEDWPKSEFFWQAAVRAAEVFPIRDPRLCKSLESLAEVYWKQGKYDQAEPLSRRVLSIYEAVLGEHHPDVGFVANNLGMLYHAQGDMPKAASLYERALPLLASKLGPQHPSVFNLETNLKNVLMTLGRMDEAEVVKAKLTDSQQGRWTRSGKFQTLNMKDSDILAQQS